MEEKKKVSNFNSNNFKNIILEKYGVKNPSQSKELQEKRKTIHLFRTAKFRHSPLNQRVSLTWTLKLNCGLVGWAKFDLNLTQSLM